MPVNVVIKDIIPDMESYQRKDVNQDIVLQYAEGSVFPVLTSFVAQTHTVTWTALFVAIFAFFYSLAQRKLPLQARFFRRKVERVTGSYILGGAPLIIVGDMAHPENHPISKETTIGPVDLALKYMTWAIVAVALGLLLGKLYG